MYMKNSSRIGYVNTGMGGCQIRQSFSLDFAGVMVWLLYRLNCLVDKQLVMGDLFFAGLWIAGNNRRGEHYVAISQ